MKKKVVYNESSLTSFQTDSRPKLFQSGIKPLLFTLVLPLIITIAALAPNLTAASPEKSSHSTKKETKKPAAHSAKTTEKKSITRHESKTAEATGKHEDARDTKEHAKTDIAAEEQADQQLSRKEIDQEIALDNGADIVLVLDSSRSMNRTDPNRYRDQGIKLLTRLFSGRDRMAVVTFDREARTISPFVTVNSSTIPDIDTAISGIVPDGGFTDIAAGVAKALEVIETEGRNGTQKLILLLTDGKMEAQPSRGTEAEVINKFKLGELRKLRQEHIPLYAISIGANADQQYLANISALTGGGHLHAADAPGLLRAFSELFILLKTPHEPTPDMASVLVPNGSSDATFVIPRVGNEKLSLIDPKGKVIDIENLPPTVKWFSGSTYELITVTNPVAGRWMAIQSDGDGSGKEGVKVFADLSILLVGLNEAVEKGTALEISAQVKSNTEPVDYTELAQVLSVNYRILARSTGRIIESGTMKPAPVTPGISAKTEELIFSTAFPINETGELDFQFTLAAPTFTHQYRSGVIATDGSISLTAGGGATPNGEHVGNEHAVENGHADKHGAEHGTPVGSEGHQEPNVEHSATNGATDSLSVNLDASLSGMRDATLELSARVPGENSSRIFRISENSQLEHHYSIDYGSLKLTPGMYRSYVRLIGTDSRGFKVYNCSNIITLTISTDVHEKPVHTKGAKKDGTAAEKHGSGKESVAKNQEEIEDEESEAELEDSGSLFGIISILCALLWSGGLIFWTLKACKPEKAQPPTVGAPVPDGLAERIGALKAKVGVERREIGDMEKELFEPFTELAFSSVKPEAENKNQAAAH